MTPLQSQKKLLELEAKRAGHSQRLQELHVKIRGYLIAWDVSDRYIHVSELADECEKVRREREDVQHEISQLTGPHYSELHK